MYCFQFFDVICVSLRQLENKHEYIFRCNCVIIQTMNFMLKRGIRLVVKFDNNKFIFMIVKENVMIVFRLYLLKIFNQIYALKT